MSAETRLPAGHISGGSNYDGYATIRPRALYRSGSIRVSNSHLDYKKPEPPLQDYQRSESVPPLQAQPTNRQRTSSIRSNLSQNSSLGGKSLELSLADDVHQIKNGLKSSLLSETEPLYASVNAQLITPSNGLDLVDNYSLSKSSRFSLDSLHSNITPKTPDYQSNEEESHHFRYSSVTENAYARLKYGRRSNGSVDSDRIYSSAAPVLPPKPSIQRNEITLKFQCNCPCSHSGCNLSQRDYTSTYAQRFSDGFANESGYQSSACDCRSSRVKRKESCFLPAVPVRRESLYSRTRNHQRSSSAELLERSCLSTIQDGDEIIIIPNAMSKFNRYHTLGHLRVQAHQDSKLHRTQSTGFESLRDLRFAASQHSLHNTTQPSSLRDLREVVNPLDLKVGCQNTLRSKPLIPWYELAIKQDIKRKSCPPLNGPLPFPNANADLGHSNAANADNKVNI